MENSNMDFKIKRLDLPKRNSVESITILEDFSVLVATNRAWLIYNPFSYRMIKRIALTDRQEEITYENGVLLSNKKFELYFSIWKTRGVLYLNRKLDLRDWDFSSFSFKVNNYLLFFSCFARAEH